jgi:hypothetical protein
MTQFD